MGLSTSQQPPSARTASQNGQKAPALQPPPAQSKPDAGWGYDQFSRINPVTGQTEYRPGWDSGAGFSGAGNQPFSGAGNQPALQPPPAVDVNAQFLGGTGRFAPGTQPAAPQGQLFIPPMQTIGAAQDATPMPMPTPNPSPVAKGNPGVAQPAASSSYQSSDPYAPNYVIPGANTAYMDQAYQASMDKFANAGIADPFDYALSGKGAAPAANGWIPPGSPAPTSAPAVGLPSSPQRPTNGMPPSWTPGAPPASLAGTEFDAMQLGNMNSALSGGNGDQIASAINAARDAAYRNATGYLDPQFANQENSLKASLANQGIPQNSEAWNKAMDDFARQKQFAYSQAESGAFNQGMSAQNQIAQQLLQALGYRTSENVANIGAASQLGTAGISANTAANALAEQHQQNLFNNSMGLRNQDINELLLQQQNPLQMYTALTTGTAPNSPNFTSAPNASVNPTDIASIYNNALAQQNNVYNAQVGSQNSQTAGMSSIAAAALMALSDRRLKKNVRAIGMHKVGVPLYVYDYVWGEPGVGVMADELERIRPDAVVTLPSGFKAVDYGRL